ncbi:hypothetical protein BCR39DRAFT_218696 [Naematelia encephala]|uniref:Ubiquitin-like protease family profile domain-containing protein n=1 Tax=Naematelia encephala TaxID=71784 RepID=A0A1Y2AYV8_9TREE|nr:hypothetical protein BCR39DRAFT_218696 [Naematelia encephala]
MIRVNIIQCAEPSILIVLPSGSTEASALIDAVGAHLRTMNEPIRYIDKFAVAALSSNYPAEYKPDDTRARAAREKERQQHSGKRNGEPSRNRRPSDVLPDIGLTKEAKIRKKEKVDGDPTQSKLNFDSFRRRSHRLSGVPPVEYEMLDNGQPSSHAVPAPVPGLSAAERNELLFPYPFFLRPEINVTKGDRYRVQSNDFLNDTLIEFGLKHLLYGNAANERHSNADRVHLFNSFFFTKIATRKGLVMPKGVWPAYDSVRRWTRNANIFDKELVVVPINESYHWYLAIIYNPKAILKERKTTPLRTEEQEDDSLPAGESETLKQARRHNYHDDTYLDELMMPANDKAIPAGDRLRSDDSIDPLDVIDQTDGDIRASLRGDSESEVEIEAGVSNGVSRMSLDGDPSGELYNADASFDAPPLITDTLTMFRQQDQRSVSVSDGDRSGSPVKKQKLARSDADILDSDQCWIMTFDSLGTAHKAAHTHIDRWLKFEARDKLGKEIDTLSDAQYWEATVPQQPNFSDCGLYLVHYAKQMLDRPEEMLRFIQVRTTRECHLQADLYSAALLCRITSTRNKPTMLS